MEYYRFKQKIAGLQNIVEIASGDSHNLALDASGRCMLGVIIHMVN